MENVIFFVTSYRNCLNIEKCKKGRNSLCYVLFLLLRGCKAKITEQVYEKLSFLSLYGNFLMQYVVVHVTKVIFLFDFGVEHALFHPLRNFKNVACYDIKISRTLERCFCYVKFMVKKE